MGLDEKKGGWRGRAWRGWGRRQKEQTDRQQERTGRGAIGSRSRAGGQQPEEDSGRQSGLDMKSSEQHTSTQSVTIQ